MREFAGLFCWPGYYICTYTMLCRQPMDVEAREVGLDSNVGGVVASNGVGDSRDDVVPATCPAESRHQQQDTGPNTREKVAAGGARIKSLAQSLPRSFRRVLQALVCGTGVAARHVYGSRSNGRYTMRLSGSWQGPVAALYSDALEEAGSDLHTARGGEPEAEPELPQDWPCVLLKMQRAADAEPDEDACHAAVTRACPHVAPRFLFSVTVGAVRLTFMEWLEECTTVYTLHRRKSQLLTPELSRVAQDCVVDMWLRAGVLHCDMHANNALVSSASSSGRFYIIDFGMAVVLPDEMRATLKTLIEEDGLRPATAYDRVCKKFAHRMLLKKGYEVDEDEDGRADWNDDADFLRLMRSYCRHGRVDADTASTLPQPLSM